MTSTQRTQANLAPPEDAAESEEVPDEFIQSDLRLLSAQSGSKGAGKQGLAGARRKGGVMSQSQVCDMLSGLWFGGLKH